jgi:hypothetical protein
MGLMDLSEAGDARKKGASRCARLADKKPKGKVLTVHDEAALRLGGQGT